MRIGNIDARGQAVFDDALNTAAIPAISFDGDVDTGFTRTAEDVIDISTGGTSRLQIESDGTLNVVGTTNYELLVLADDDIPNRKFVVDQVVNASTEFADDVFRVQDNGDATKELAFEVAAITTGTTRTITWPDQNLDIDLTTVSTGSTITSSNVYVTTIT